MFSQVGRTQFEPGRTHLDPPQDPVGCACNTTSGPPRPTKTRIFYFVVSTIRYLTRFDFQRSTGNVRNTSVSFFLWGSSTRLHAVSFLTGRKKLAHGNGLSITLSRRRLGQIDPSRVPCARPTVSVNLVSAPIVHQSHAGKPRRIRFKDFPTRGSCAPETCSVAVRQHFHKYRFPLLDMSDVRLLHID